MIAIAQLLLMIVAIAVVLGLFLHSLAADKKS